jgi:hypothetical protein
MGQSNFIWAIGIIVLVSAIAFIFSSLNRPSHKLLKLTRKLSDAEITNDKADQLIGLLISIKAMPKKTAFWDSIKTAFRLVEQSDNVDIELKLKLRTLLQGLSVQKMDLNQKIS